MRRAASILIGILLGALATGIGTGFFLKKANDDRERLAETVQKTVEQATTARTENSRAIEDANAKLNAANLEVAKAQALIKALQEEQQALATATVLLPPTAKTVRGWTDVLRLDLGISLKLPPILVAASSTSDGLVATLVTGSQTDGRVLSIMRYDAVREQEWLSVVASSTPISFVIDSHLVSGVKGVMRMQGTPLYVLRVRSQGTSTHLIWLRELPRSSFDPLILLSSIRFES
jgi:hypothetical protein